MRHCLRAAAVLVAAGALSLIASPSAHAYIDPQSGSYVIQILIAGLAAGGLAVATFWRRIFAFFKRLVGRAGEEKSSSAPPSAEFPPVAPKVEKSKEPTAPPADEAPDSHP
jgi:hypothetical protein